MHIPKFGSTQSSNGGVRGALLNKVVSTSLEIFSRDISGLVQDATQVSHHPSVTATPLAAGPFLGRI